MALFKILSGDSSRISTDITSLHPGYAYFTPDDGSLYIDATVNSEGKRIKVGASKSVNATLSASAWSNGQQTVTISGLKSDQNGTVSLSQSCTLEQYEEARNASILVTGQAKNSLTFTVNGDTPTVDIPITVILLS